jgi:Secretion system C-terminal sorting domain
MRKSLYLSLFLLCFFGFSQTKAQGGGPDAFGYTWLSSTDAGGPTYNWIDITAAGTPITGLADDNVVGPFNTGFSFHYYWSDYTQVKVGSNGWVRFGNASQNIAHCFPTMPTAGGSGGDNFLAVLMNDLNFSGAGNYGNAYYWTNNVDSFIVTYDSVPQWVQANPDYQGYRTFQVILDGTDSSITFQYKGSDGTFTDVAGCASDVEIGIENITGNIGLEVLNEALPPNTWAVKFYYPAVALIQIPDATPNWAANVDNAGQFYQFGNAVSLQAEIKNVGNGDITNDITANATIRDLALNSVYNSTGTVAGGLTVGSAQTVTFPTTFTATIPGQYYYQVATVNSQDINPSNNQTEVEISVPAVNGNGELQLTYSTGNPPDGVIAWAGGSGDDGGGIKIVPPGSPCIVKSVEMFILGDGDIATPMVNGFSAELRNEVAGAPGTLLSNVTVPAGSVVEDDWNVVTFSSPVTIPNGEAFYVGWIMSGDTIGLGTEAFGPISRRSYEILGGAWAVYRENATSDLLIRVNLDSSIISGVNTPVNENITMALYPNPAQEMVTVTYENRIGADVNFTINNLYGQQVYNRGHNGFGAGAFNFLINTADLASGVYFLNMEVGTEKITKKLIVSH